MLVSFFAVDDFSLDAAAAIPSKYSCCCTRRGFGKTNFVPMLY